MFAQGCRGAVANPPAVHFAARTLLPAIFAALAASVAMPRVPWLRPANAQSVSTLAASAADDATSSNNQVKLVRDRAGQLIAAYVQNIDGTPQVILAVSQDEGRSWTPLAQASSGPIASRLPTLDLDGGGRLHVAWTRYDDGVGKIYYRVWQGRWVASQQRISPSPGYAGFPALAVDGVGNPTFSGTAFVPHRSPAGRVTNRSTRFSTPDTTAARGRPRSSSPRGCPTRSTPR